MAFYGKICACRIVNANTLQIFFWSWQGLQEMTITMALIHTHTEHRIYTEAELDPGEEGRVKRFFGFWCVLFGVSCVVFC